MMKMEDHFHNLLMICIRYIYTYNKTLVDLFIYSAQDAPEDAVVTTCEHVFCNQCISERLTGGEDSSLCPKCRSRLSLASLFTKSALKSSLSGGTLVKEEELSDANMPSMSLSCTSHSTKIKMALDILHSLPPLEVKCEEGEEIERKPFEKKPVITEKAIVFSQWTRMLDMLEAPLKESRLQYRRLDGTMSVTAREKAIKDFNTLPEVLFLSFPSVYGLYVYINFYGSICISANILLLLYSVFVIGICIVWNICK